ncbi:type I-U CRISPR-associated helicase/endonuclease Cas3 [Candidatus Poriferisodalis sp.]|uniref:type I-G CRISPR-associated helicase/endonuclease Cas3g n=1 Tax=Candidatus Poriferisodalis sp. TaxID=3101277 RepID=UPI003B023744
MSAESLSAEDFAGYFTSVHGYEPYPWQERLTGQVLAEGRWPDVIDLPTGAGKTAVLDTAVFTLAARPDVFPRRVVFVIDRRIVVDQVYERARKISDSIRAAENGVLNRMRSVLGDTADDLTDLIGVSALRGGVPIDNDWSLRPDQPWVMVSTVDQFGSKLLFRGYGVSQGMWPIHAGLAGNDCLVILDEVHLSRPFVDTLRGIEKEPTVNSLNADLLPRRGCIVEMSATPPCEDRRRFALQPAADLDGRDAPSSRLRQITRAAKRATLIPIAGSAAHAALPRKITTILEKELEPHERSIGVVVNRVRTAREVDRALRRAGVSSHLITGRMRPLDRARRLREIQALVDPDIRDPDAGRTVVVATQAIEVGADFSFDALITEACPVDSLRQRVGRLDRRGSLAAQMNEPARCWVLGLKSDVEGKRSDPIYGEAVKVTWRELNERAAGGHIDIGSSSESLADMPPDASAPTAEAPLLLPTHIEAWSQTRPEPLVQPEISEFLHGFDENPPEPEVSVVWRRDPRRDALQAVRPRQAEYLTVPISAARAWLQRDDETPIADVATPAPDDSPGHASGDGVATAGQHRVCRYLGGDAVIEEVDIDELKPGDVIVVDPSRGGLSGGTWDPQGVVAAESSSPDSGDAATAQEAVADLGDEAQWAYGKRCTIRLDGQLQEWIAEWLGDEAPRLPRPHSDQFADSDDPIGDARTPDEKIDEWIEALLGHDRETVPPQLRWLFESPASDRNDGAGALVRLSDPSRRSRSLVSDSDDGVRPIGRSPGVGDYYVLFERQPDISASREDDDASLTGTGIPLRRHLEGVGARVERFAKNLGLGAELVADLRLAGELHDLGKVDRRFQAQMVGHDRVQLELLDEPLAKSLRGARIRRRSWPPVRHEIASVALAQSSSALMERAHDADLVLHLVATHHGHSRPLPRIVPDDCPQDLAYQHDGHALSARSDFSQSTLALEMADRFWRLSTKYGHHGLAWLEAILRRADHRQSEAEAQGLASADQEVR